MKDHDIVLTLSCNSKILSFSLQNSIFIASGVLELFESRAFDWSSQLANTTEIHLLVVWMNFCHNISAFVRFVQVTILYNSLVRLVL